MNVTGESWCNVKELALVPMLTAAWPALTPGEEPWIFNCYQNTRKPLFKSQKHDLWSFSCMPTNKTNYERKEKNHTLDQVIVSMSNTLTSPWYWSPQSPPYTKSLFPIARVLWLSLGTGKSPLTGGEVHLMVRRSRTCKSFK